jgi:hypothetical protein
VDRDERKLEVEKRKSKKANKLTSTTQEIVFQQLRENSSTHREFGLLKKLKDKIIKGKVYKALSLLKKKKATLFLRVNTGWDVTDAFERQDIWTEMGLSKREVRQAMRQAENRKKLWGGKKVEKARGSGEMRGGSSSGGGVASSSSSSVLSVQIP